MQGELPSLYELLFDYGYGVRFTDIWRRIRGKPRGHKGRRFANSGTPEVHERYEPFFQNGLSAGMDYVYVGDVMVAASFWQGDEEMRESKRRMNRVSNLLHDMLGDEDYCYTANQDD